MCVRVCSLCISVRDLQCMYRRLVDSFDKHFTQVLREIHEHSTLNWLVKNIKLNVLGDLKKSINTFFVLVDVMKIGKT